MRAGLAIVIALVIGAFAAHLVLEDGGYVLIEARGYVIEMSLPGLAVVLAVLYLLVRAVVAVWNAPHRLGRAVADRRHRRAGGQLTRGLVLLADGRWEKGERLLGRAAGASDVPLASYLLAARAAQRQGQPVRRDEWLRLACETVPDAAAAVRVEQAMLQLEAGEAAQALATARRVLADEPAHPAALAIAAQAAEHLGDRAALESLLPRLPKADLPRQRIAELIDEALKAPFASVELTSAELERRWSALPKDLRRMAPLVRRRALALDRLGRGADAARELKPAIERGWEPALIATYAELADAEVPPRLAQAERWLQNRPDSPALLVTAARLCIAAELWGKARSYIESAIAIEPAPQSYALYGQLLEKLGEGERATLAFRSGLSLASETPAALPALAPPGSGGSS